MHDKLLTSIVNLKNWSERILTDSTGKQMRLTSFLDGFNIQDYQKFYLELLPFITELNSNELLQNLSLIYEKNGTALNEAMKQYFSFYFLESILSNLPIIGRSADDLIKVIREIKSNTENLEYSLNISYASD